MNQIITLNKKQVSVSFTNYFDSVLGEFLFRQVMCDVFMPGNEVVPIVIEKEQIRLVLEGFKNRKELYNEIRKEDIKGQSVYVITPQMRYDLRWLKGPKPKKPLTKEKPPSDDDDDDYDIPGVTTAVQPEKPAAKPREFNDARRKYLLSIGFVFNEATNNWVRKGIRFPDNKINAAASDDQFIDDMTRLIAADERSRQKRPTKSE
ncbi:hypothetical protein [Cohnella yongneupensis]|uniref:Uncharacterized protein n=1 Tax=Cohnella yongneupensis TaxID=425006 RepID=A0ABW0QX58_9BACL